MAKIDFVAKSVRDYQEDGEMKTRWTDIGVAFINKDSITVMLNALPLGDKIVLMKPVERKPEEAPKKMPLFRSDSPLY